MQRLYKLRSKALDTQMKVNILIGNLASMGCTIDPRRPGVSVSTYTRKFRKDLGSFLPLLLTGAYIYELKQKNKALERENETLKQKNEALEKNNKALIDDMEKTLEDKYPTNEN